MNTDLPTFPRPDEQSGVPIKGDVPTVLSIESQERSHEVKGSPQRHAAGTGATSQKSFDAALHDASTKKNISARRVERSKSVPDPIAKESEAPEASAARGPLAPIVPVGTLPLELSFLAIPEATVEGEPLSRGDGSTAPAGPFEGFDDGGLDCEMSLPIQARSNAGTVAGAALPNLTDSNTRRPWWSTGASTWRTRTASEGVIVDTDKGSNGAENREDVDTKGLGETEALVGLLGLSEPTEGQTHGAATEQMSGGPESYGIGGAKNATWMKNVEENAPARSSQRQVLPGTAGFAALDDADAAPNRSSKNGASSADTTTAISALSLNESASGSSAANSRQLTDVNIRSIRASDGSIDMLPISPTFMSPGGQAEMMGRTAVSESISNPPGSDMERVHVLITNWAVEVRRAQAEVMDVVLKPNHMTELSLRLSLENGIVAVSATCRHGDFANLNANWEQLQASLSTQGIRLGALQPPNPQDAPKYANGFGQGDRERANQPEAREDSPRRPSTNPTVPTPRPNTAASSRARGQAWESWA